MTVVVGVGGVGYVYSSPARRSRERYDDRDRDRRRDDERDRDRGRDERDRGRDRDSRDSGKDRDRDRYDDRSKRALSFSLLSSLSRPLYHSLVLSLSLARSLSLSLVPRRSRPP